MIALYKPFMPGLPELDAILHSGALTYGKYCRKFEEKLREYFGTDKLLVTNSFNTAISVAITALNLNFGDEIIASPMGCLASTQPYLSAGMRIKWADVDPTTGTLNPDSVQKNLTSKTRAIVHNHFCGYPGYIDEINEIAKQYGIPVIDDGIECFGSEYHEQKIGNCGTDCTVFSLTAVRNPNTIDGGIVIFKNEEAFNRAVLIRDCGIDRTKFRDELGEIATTCDITLMGYSATMSELNGYIGLKQMEHIEKIIQTSRKNAEIWKSKIESFDHIKALTRKRTNPNYWVFSVLTSDKIQTICDFREKGFYASGVHVNNSLYSVFELSKVALLGAQEFHKNHVALPCGWWVNIAEEGERIDEYN